MQITRCLIIVLLGINHLSLTGQSTDASPAGIIISHSHPIGGWMLSYNYMRMDMRHNFSRTHRVSDESIWNDYLFSPQDMNMDMHMLMAMHGITGRFSVMVMANYLSSNMTLQALPGSGIPHHHSDGSISLSYITSHSHKTSGLGDFKLWAIYKVLNGQGSSLVVSAGLNIPSGKIDIEANEHAIIDGEHHPYMMQLGSGSFDLLPGITYLRKSSKINWSIQALGTLRTFNNSIGYIYGNELTLNAWAAYQLNGEISFSARVESLFSGAIDGRDPKIYAILEPDANPDNYGGQRVSGYIGLNYYLDKLRLSESKLGIEVGMPVYQYLNGPQLSNRFCLNASFTKSF